MSNWRLGWRFIKGIDILLHYAGGESGVRAAAQKGAILFHKREWPPLNPPRERFRLAVWSLNNLCASGMQLPARGFAALALLYDLTCSYYPLPLCSSCRSTA